MEDIEVIEMSENTQVIKSRVDSKEIFEKGNWVYQQKNKL